MGQITYGTKADNTTSPLADANKVTAADMNEIKTQHNLTDTQADLGVTNAATAQAAADTNASNIATNVTDIGNLQTTSGAFGAEITFDKNRYKGSYSLSSGDLTLTLAASGNVAFNKVYFTLVADGVGSFTCPVAWLVVDSSFNNGTVPAAGTYQIWMMYDGTDVFIQRISATLAATFDPTDISSLIFALDEGNTVGSPDVTQWTDDSGNNFHAIVSTFNSPSTDGSLVTFDPANSEGLDFTTFTPYTDTSGEFVIKFKSNLSVLQTFVSVEFSGSNNGRLLIAANTSGDLYIVDKPASSGNTVIWTAVLSDATDYVISIGSSGTAYKLEINGVDQGTPDSGSDTGNWIGDITSADAISLGVRQDAVADYEEALLYSVYYFNAQLSTADRASMFTLLI